MDEFPQALSAGSDFTVMAPGGEFHLRLFRILANKHEAFTGIIFIELFLSFA